MNAEHSVQSIIGATDRRQGLKAEAGATGVGLRWDIDGGDIRRGDV